jgi:predicted membrane protein (TIGR00267 family)
LGGAIPLLPYILFSGMTALYISIALAGVTLFSVGVFKGRLAGLPIFASGIQFFAIAVGASLFGYLIGLGVQHFFPGIQIPGG